MTLKLNKDELSLLLYLETRAVDYLGRVDEKHMSENDLGINLKTLKANGLLDFGRIASEDITHSGAHWVRFTDKGYFVAAAERLDRAERNWLKRPYKTTKEKRETAA